MKYHFDRFYPDHCRRALLLLCVVLASPLVMAGTLSQSPLFIGSGVKPNIMLMIDNSGSMNNIVQQAPYDPNVTSTNCPATSQIPACITQSCIDIIINNNQPAFKYSGQIYTLGTNTGNGQRCFDNNAIYAARLNADKQVNYSSALYSGHYLNWYFNPNTTTTWTNQTQKPGTLSRMEIAKEAAKDFIDSLSNVRLGLAAYHSETINGNVQGQGGSLREVISDIDASKMTTMKTKIDALLPREFTPLAETLSDIGKYFALGEPGNLTLHPNATNQSQDTVDNIFKLDGVNHDIKNDTGGQRITDPVIYSCQKNYVYLLTDGRPSTDRAISTPLRDYSGDCAAGKCDATSDAAVLPITAIANTGSTTQCNDTEKNWRACKNGTQVGRTYETTGSDYLDDVADALYEMDLRPSLGAEINNVVTYTIGFADTSVVNDPLLNETAIRGGGKFFNAADSKSLASAFQDALLDIDSTSQAFAAVSANSSQLDTSTLIYQSQFDPSVWTGDLVAFSVDITNGSITKNWSANDKLPVPASRNIYTFNPTAAAGQRGALFQWPNLTCPGPASTTCLAANIVGGGNSQQEQLNQDNLANTTDTNGALRVSWIQGGHTNEKTSRTDTTAGHIFRQRFILNRDTGISTYRNLGDIVNSDPIFVGAQDYGYGEFADIGASYRTFIESAAYKNRTPVIYVGANDGMLHGFDARKNDLTTTPPITTGGQEIFAYIPNAVYPSLSNLTSPNYIKHHQYFVDGPPAAGDVFDTTTLTWRTMLVGAMGAGGRAYFALDVTNPSTFGSSSPLWEFTEANDADLGYTLGQASIVRLQDNSWAVIIANGYNSDNGSAVLFVLDALTGAVLQKLDTGAKPSTQLPPLTSAKKNGLSIPVAVDTDTDFKVDTVYAGDLYGNLWKFDLRGIHGSWVVPTSPLFVACATDSTLCSNDDRQPITAKPNVGHPGGAGTDQNGVGNMVYFGTGKFFEMGDNIVPTSPAPQRQSFYGLWDTGSPITSRTFLQTQTITFDDFGDVTCATGTGTCKTDKKIRIVSSNPVCYAATSTGCTTNSSLVKGWKLDLQKPPLASPALVGERVFSFPLIRRGLVVFATAIPGSVGCQSNGESRLMELDALTGGASPDSAFDTNGDGAVDDKDKVILSGNKVAAAGVDLGIGIIKTPAVVEGQPSTVTSPNGATTTKVGVDYKYASGTKSASIAKVVDKGPTSSAATSVGTRRAWKQLK